MVKNINSKIRIQKKRRKSYKLDLTKSKSGDKWQSFEKKLSTNIKTIKIIDNIYPISNLTKKISKIRDHINLSGFNPLKGPKFVPLSNIYKSKKGILVAGLKEGVVPNKHELKVLNKLGVQAYCYNLIPVAIISASLGIKIDAFGIMRNN